MSLTMLTELQTAIIDGDISKAIALLYDDDNEIKRNINRPYYQSQYNSKVTTLYLACDYGIDQIVEILLAIPEIDVNYEAERGADTPLHAAASGGFTKIVELLLAVKCHCVASMFGSTPIQRAAGNGHPEVLALLLDYDKKKLINHETLNKTPLHWACKHGHLQCVKILVQHGADPTVRNPNNKCPVEMAMEKGHREIVRFLKGQEDEVSFIQIKVCCISLLNYECINYVVFYNYTGVILYTYIACVQNSFRLVIQTHLM